MEDDLQDLAGLCLVGPSDVRAFLKPSPIAVSSGFNG